MDYAGISYEESMESVSLKPIVDGERESVRKYAISELIKPNPKGLITSFGTVTDGRWKLIMQIGEEERLYDLMSDPFEEDNLAAEFPEEVERLKTAFGDRGEKPNPAIELYVKSFDA